MKGSSLEDSRNPTAREPRERSRSSWRGSSILSWPSASASASPCRALRPALQTGDATLPLLYAGRIWEEIARASGDEGLGLRVGAGLAFRGRSARATRGRIPDHRKGPRRRGGCGRAILPRRANVDHPRRCRRVGAASAYRCAPPGPPPGQRLRAPDRDRHRTPRGGSAVATRRAAPRRTSAHARRGAGCTGHEVGPLRRTGRNPGVSAKRARAAAATRGEVSLHTRLLAAGRRLRRLHPPGDPGPAARSAS